MQAFHTLVRTVLRQRAPAPSFANAADLSTDLSPVSVPAPVSALTSEAPGIPALAIGDVLSPHQDLIDRISMCYGMGPSAFAQELLPLIQRYAEFVHLLPATPDHYFSAPGGLLRMGLEVAFFSLQGVDGQIFAGRSTVTVRRRLEPRWRQATFIAGLCCAIDRPFWLMRVTSDRSDEWQPYLLPLSKWLVQNQSARYFLKWRPSTPEPRAMGLFALVHIVPGDVLQHLATRNDVIVPQMIGSITGVPLCRQRSVLDELVRRSMTLVIGRDLQNKADRHSALRADSHLASGLIDALRWLVSAHPVWRPNAEHSRVWFGSDGVFLVWPDAASEIRELWESQQLPDMPKTPDAMLAILEKSGVVHRYDASRVTWNILPPESQAVVDAVKFSSPEILFADLDPAPIPLSIALSREPEPKTTPVIKASADDQARASSAQLTAPACSHAEAPSSSDCASSRRSKSDRKTDTSPPPTTGGPVQFPLPLEMPKFKLDAPMRLDPAVCHALAHIIDSMNRDDARTAVCILPAGVFIPVTEFERYNIEPSLASRALTDANMLIQRGDTRTHTLTGDVGGASKVGLLLDPRFVSGLDLADFANPDTSGATC